MKDTEDRRLSRKRPGIAPGRGTQQTPVVRKLWKYGSPLKSSTSADEARRHPGGNAPTPGQAANSLAASKRRKRCFLLSGDFSIGPPRPNSPSRNAQPRGKMPSSHTKKPSSGCCKTHLSFPHECHHLVIRPAHLEHGFHHSWTLTLRPEIQLAGELITTPNNELV